MSDIMEPPGTPQPTPEIQDGPNPPGRTSGSRQRALTIGVGAAVIAVIVAGSLIVTAARSGDDTTAPPGPGREQPKPPVTAPPSGAAPPTAPPTYRAVLKPCDVVDASAIARRLGPPQETQDRSTPVGRTMIMRCSIRYVGYVFSAQIDIMDDGTGEAMFEGLRQVQQEQTQVNALPGIGTAAYTYTDPLTGPHLVTYDANLYMSLALASLRSAGVPGDVTTELAEVAKATLARMRGPA